MLRVCDARNEVRTWRRRFVMHVMRYVVGHTDLGKSESLWIFTNSRPAVIEAYFQQTTTAHWAVDIHIDKEMQKSFGGSGNNFYFA
jgi:hypothetical protein